MLQIKLENTLSDLFAVDGNRGNPEVPRIVFVSYNPISDDEQSKNLPRNTKYLIQQWRETGESDISPILNLILMPQKMSWIAGKMTVVFFKDGTYGTQENESLFSTVEEDLAETLGCIDQSCRFEPTFCTSIEHIEVVARDSVIIPFLPADGLDHLPHLLEPEKHYELLSKRELALSGLPTLTADLIDFAIPKSGWNDTTLKSNVARALEILCNRKLPFVLKTNSSGGSKGVYLVRTAIDRARIEEEIKIHLMSELCNLNQDNARLHPYTLVLTDLLPGNAAALNFYINNNGEARPSSCCEPVYSDTGIWQGGTITYSEQNDLLRHYMEIMHKTAKFLYSKGYYGPVGIDVMTDDGGTQYIVDLNPRPTGSFILGCLRPHFVEKLAMDVACVLPFMEFLAGRVEFGIAFNEELTRGELIILAWWSDPGIPHSLACLAAGGIDKPSMMKLCSSIERWMKARQSPEMCRLCPVR